MNTTPTPVKESSSKTWIVLLLVATIVSFVVLVIAVKQALAPVSTSMRNASLQSAADVEADSASQQELTSSPVLHSPRAQSKTIFPAPVEPKALTPEEQKQQYQQQVHQQAQYLRAMAADPKNHGGPYDLTPQQIDDMEKKGVMVW